MNEISLSAPAKVSPSKELSARKPAPEKFILDATAANRTIYETKTSDKIIYLDVERKPTIFADNNHLPFQNGVCHTIIYDPPYWWSNAKQDIFFGIPDAKTYNQIRNQNRKFPTYYGTDKFKTRSQLIKSVYQALREFERVLADNGLLWVKWCENAIPLDKFLSLFNSFTLLLKIEVRDDLARGSFQTFWLAFLHKNFVEGFDFMKIPEKEALYEKEPV